MELVKQATENYPRFEDGRIDYSKERVCFVLNCVVVSGDKILLTERGADVIAYPNTVNGISGFIDRVDASVKSQAEAELSEELQAPLDKIVNLSISEEFVQIDESINREWHVFAVLVEFSEQFDPKTNWENKSATWYLIDDIENMQLMPGFAETVRTALKLR